MSLASDVARAAKRAGMWRYQGKANTTADVLAGKRLCKKRWVRAWRRVSKRLAREAQDAAG